MVNKEEETSLFFNKLLKSQDSLYFTIESQSP